MGLMFPFEPSAGGQGSGQYEASLVQDEKRIAMKNRLAVLTLKTSVVLPDHFFGAYF